MLDLARVLPALVLVHLAVAPAAAQSGPGPGPGPGSAARQCAAQVRQGDTAICEQAIREDPADLAARRNLALAWLMQNDGEHCFEAYRAVIALAPDDPVSHYDYAVALATFRRYEEAVAPVREAIRLKPDYRDAHIVASLSYQYLRRHDEALTALTRSAELGYQLAMYDLAVAHERGLGTPRDDAAARHWLERAAATGHVAALERLTDIYLTGGLGVSADAMAAEAWAEKAWRARQGLVR